MNISERDRGVLRELAARVAEAAALPIQQERAELIRDLNHLRPRRPVVLAFPEGGWRELVPEEALLCDDPLLRQWERHLRSQVFRHEMIRDDYPLLPHFNIRWRVEVGDFGLQETRTRTEELGSYVWDPPVKSRDDFARLHPRHVEIDRPETARQAETAHEILGDLLEVRIHGSLWWSLGLTGDLVLLRGLEQTMLDMYDDPQLLHDMMALLRDDMMHLLDVYEAEGILSLNNGPDDYVGSGGLGHTDELPAEDFDGTARCADMWVLSESQETVGVGPEQFAEFILPYQLPLMERFGLVCYGCCEPLDTRLDLLIERVPALRRVSVSPWFNRRLAAEKLADRYVYSWKPNPTLVCAPKVNWLEVERTTRETVETARGCCLEMILKDTHTFHNDPERIGRWVEIALGAAKGE